MKSLSFGVTYYTAIVSRREIRAFNWTRRKLAHIVDEAPRKHQDMAVVLDPLLWWQFLNLPYLSGEEVWFTNTNVNSIKNPKFSLPVTLTTSPVLNTCALVYPQPIKGNTTSSIWLKSHLTLRKGTAFDADFSIIPPNILEFFMPKMQVSIPLWTCSKREKIKLPSQKWMWKLFLSSHQTGLWFLTATQRENNG